MNFYKFFDLKVLFLNLIMLILLLIPSIASALTTITFWHSMSGQLGEVLDTIIQRFNHSQKEYRIVSVYKGDYVETLTSTVAAFRAHRAPDLVQVFEVGTATMLFPKGVIVPVETIMKTSQSHWQARQLLAAIRFYYSNDQGHLMAMPFNCSSAVMYYNKNALLKAGTNPNHPPKTWNDVEKVSQRLLKAGYACGFTTAWPSWIQLETFSAWHNLPYASGDNGFKGVDVNVILNNPIVINHVEHFSKWQKQGIFQYGGRNSDAEALFTSGKCPILFESSGARPALMANTDFEVGIAPLPYWSDVKNAPQNTIIGGASIWALSGHPSEVYKGIAHFFEYLMSPKVQIEWQNKTGYVPVTREAVRKLKKSGYYRQHPDAEIAIKSLNYKVPTTYSKGIRLGYYSQIRQINDTALEAVWSGQKTAQAALREAAEEDNRLLHRFKENVAW